MPEQPVVSDVAPVQSVPEQPVLSDAAPVQSVPEQPVLSDVAPVQSVPEQPVLSDAQNGLETSTMSQLSEPTPQVMDFVQDSSSVVAQPQQDAMSNGAQVNNAQAVNEQAGMANDLLDTGSGTIEANDTKQDGNNKSIKGWKNTLIFFAVLVAIVAIFIIVLPHLINIGG